MKKLLIIISVITFFSCGNEEEIPDANYLFVIEEKIKLDGDYFVKSSKDSTIQISKKQYVEFNIQDSLIIGIVRDGFYKGRSYLIKRY